MHQKHCHTYAQDIPSTAAVTNIGQSMMSGSVTDLLANGHVPAVMVACATKHYCVQVRDDVELLIGDVRVLHPGGPDHLTPTHPKTPSHSHKLHLFSEHSYLSCHVQLGEHCRAVLHHPN